MSSVEQKIISGFKEHLGNQFENQRRGTKSIKTGEPHRYLDTHLEEVPRLTAETIRRVREVCPQMLTGLDPLLIEIIARGHDLLEDGYGSHCPKGCERKPTCPEHYERLAQDTRDKLTELGLNEKDAVFCVEKIRALSKDFSVTSKTERNAGLYQGLRQEPFEVRCVKVGDNWHNMLTLSGRGFSKAVRNYVRVRKSWPTVFSDQELAVLSAADLVEYPDEMKMRTFIFGHLFSAMERKGDLPDLWLPVEGERNKMANPRKAYWEEIERMESEGIFIGEHDGIERKIENLCIPGVSMSTGPKIPVAAEGQIVLAKMMEREKLATLFMYRDLGVKIMKKCIKELMYEDYQISNGRSNPFSANLGERERALMFLDSTGMTGEALEKIEDEAEYYRIVDEAIAKEQGKK